MTKPYLPAWATAQEAAEWLQAETGEPWPLPRLIESGAVLGAWLDCPADVSPECLEQVFQGRRAGFMARVVYGSDRERLACVRDGGTLTYTARPDNTPIRLTPPARFDADDVRFSAASLRHLAAGVDANEAAEPAPAVVPKPSGDEAWKEQARAAAVAIVKRDAARDRYPPQSRIADEVASDLRKRGVFGPDGKPLSGGTIKRHALRGISSATKKAQSTTITRGK